MPRGFGVGDADAPGPPRCACAPERPARADAIADDIADIACGALIPAMRGPYASVESRWPARPSVKKAAMRRHLGAARRRIAEGLLFPRRAMRAPGGSVRVRFELYKRES